jgi:L-threonylcarbamoyladenylate synthase
MMSRHYAPRTPLECVEGDATERVRALIDAGERVGWVVYSHWPIWGNLLALDPDSAWGKVYSAALPCDAAECAAMLYQLLHHLDEDFNESIKLTRIVVELPPDSPEWQAVRDRLRRAGAR